MKKLLFVFLFTSLNLFSQSNDDRFHFYEPNGNEIIVKEKEPITIRYFLDNYFPGLKFTYNNSNFKLYNEETKEGILSVYYIQFTDKPIFILGSKNIKKSDIKTALSSFNYEKYLNGWEFDYYLKKYIKEGIFKIEEVYNIFGKPDELSETVEYKTFQYNNLKLFLTLKNDVVIDFLHSK